MPTPRQWFRNALDDFRADRTGNQRRAQIRADVALMVEAAQDWLARTDAQENGAQAAFVADRAAQFRTFVDALPAVEPDQTP
jgi:CHASE2 domain-containing sensor protein